MSAQATKRPPKVTAKAKRLTAVDKLLIKAVARALGVAT